jgi:isopenicillin-N N-acyltransferase-like protein
MRRLKKIGKGILWVLLSLIALLGLFFLYMVYVSKINPPEIANRNSEQWQRVDHGNGFYTLKNNWLRKSNSGLYELYIEGEPFERGVVNGKLTKELVQRQEDAFTEQISKMIPSNIYRHFLKYFIGFFNRNLTDNITEEYKEQIYGISLSASDKYDYIGTNYARILNYHAAHDIGHALQTMALVGCTSFGTWNNASADSSLIIGRNFDFYVGDKFAEDKIVAFFAPAQGHKYMTVTWGGFTGAVSGMNDKGLTVTINAAKTTMPSGSATPVSLVATEILQYASNIREAFEIAKKRKMFVSESFLIGSAADNKAVVIEKTPAELYMYDPNQNSILCTNHFQSDSLGNSEKNLEQIKESASPYRYKRLTQLLQQSGPNTVQKTVNILRDVRGIDNADIGLGNEKAINQFIAHHSIVFEPKKRLVWVSTSPWQMGQFMAYDLKKIFATKGMTQNKEIYDSSLTIATDSFLQTKAFAGFMRYRKYKQDIADNHPINTDSLVTSDPNYYHAYVLAADYLLSQKKYQNAIKFYQTALTKEIATTKERDYIHTQIEKANKLIAK